MTDNATVFDRIGESYEEFHEANPAQLNALTTLCDRLPPSATVLDLGCGTGAPAAVMVTERGHQYVGVDSSAVMLAAARRKALPGAVFLLGNIRDAVTWSLSVDAAIAHFSFVMLARRDIEQALADLNARLAPGGLLSIAMPEFDGDEVPVTFMDETFLASGYTVEGLGRVLDDAGFDVVESVTHVQELPGAGPEPQYFVLAQRRG